MERKSGSYVFLFVICILILCIPLYVFSGHIAFFLIVQGYRQAFESPSSVTIVRHEITSIPCPDNYFAKKCYEATTYGHFGPNNSPCDIPSSLISINYQEMNRTLHGTDYSLQIGKQYDLYPQYEPGFWSKYTCVTEKRFHNGRVGIVCVAFFVGILWCSLHLILLWNIMNLSKLWVSDPIDSPTPILDLEVQLPAASAASGTTSTSVASTSFEESITLSNISLRNRSIKGNPQSGC